MCVGPGHPPGARTTPIWRSLGVGVHHLPDAGVQIRHLPGGGPGHHHLGLGGCLTSGHCRSAFSASILGVVSCFYKKWHGQILILNQSYLTGSVSSGRSHILMGSTVRQSRRCRDCTLGNPEAVGSAPPLGLAPGSWGWHPAGVGNLKCRVDTWVSPDTVGIAWLGNPDTVDCRDLPMGESRHCRNCSESPTLPGLSGLCTPSGVGTPSGVWGWKTRSVGLRLFGVPTPSGLSGWEIPTMSSVGIFPWENPDTAGIAPNSRRSWAVGIAPPLGLAPPLRLETPKCRDDTWGSPDTVGIAWLGNPDTVGIVGANGWGLGRGAPPPGCPVNRRLVLKLGSAHGQGPLVYL